MQGRKTYQENLFTNFLLSDRVPPENFYRRLKQTLDLDFFHKTTVCYYGTEGKEDQAKYGRTRTRHTHQFYGNAKGEYTRERSGDQVYADGCSCLQHQEGNEVYQKESNDSDNAITTSVYPSIFRALFCSHG